MKEINCLGMECPLPIIKTKKYFDSIEKGEAIVIVDNKISSDNIVKYAIGCNYNSTVVNKDNKFIITIVKDTITEKLESNDKFVIIVSTDKLGEGDNSLGEILMKGYIYTLSESDILPNKIILLNSGVKLAVNTSPVLDSLIKLKERNVEILSCGTCLDFYGLKDDLSIGNITNMYTIVEVMNSYNKVIKL